MDNLKACKKDVALSLQNLTTLYITIQFVNLGEKDC